MSPRYIFFLILGVDAFILFFQISQLSISYSEAQLFYQEPSLLQFLVKSSVGILGHNEFGLRIVMILLHLASATLLYAISAKYIKTERNRLWLLLIFVLLPGVVSSAVIVNSAGLLIFGLLLFVYLEQHIQQKYLNILLFFYVFLDIGYAYLFLALSVYYIQRGEKKLFLYMLALYALVSYLYGFEVHGFPTGHFLDTIGVYSAIFTPFIFIYICYALYRRYFSDETDIVWYLATVVLILSLILSFRQQLPLEHFAPYVILALPLAAQNFISSYRVRLKQFRVKYRVVFVLTFVFLTLNTFFVFFNRELYRVIDKPSHHFAYDSNVAKELAVALKQKGIQCIKTDMQMQLRLRFYGLKECAKYHLQEIPLNASRDSDVTIRYKNRVVYRASVTNINNI